MSEQRQICLHVIYGFKGEVDRAVAEWADAVTWIVEATDGDFAVRAFGHPIGQPVRLPPLSTAGSLVVDALDGDGLAALFARPAAEAGRLRLQHGLVVALKKTVGEMIAGLAAVVSRQPAETPAAASPFSLN